ncbi:MAG: beta-phosphoglucomutase [Saprospiraceae bacterium]|nr:beta-phosphoglucomutase [Saprospiraceae bacterium]MBP6521824.1 beta-phosphoglucomutase [Saprospiraceae bacterium]
MINKQPSFGFIFDLDGVIVDTSRYHFEAWKKLASKFGFVLTESFNEHLKGVERMKSLEIILHAAELNLSQEIKERLAAQKNEYYLELIANISEKDILPGVLRFLEETKELSIPIALGSASKNAMLLLDKTGVRHFFHTVVDGIKVSRSKPDPEVFVTAAKGIGVLPEDCIVFEDSMKGLEAAVRAGMHTVGIGIDPVLSAAQLVIPDFTSITAKDIVEWFDTSNKIASGEIVL